MEYTEKNNLLKDIKKNEEAIKKNNEIDIEGDIEFVSSEGMSLILVDTPGPNNSRDFHHQEMTFRMLEDSDKSLVLFVMNGRQLGINDEKVFLDFICANMKKGGKKTRDRYIFAVNQLDAFKPNPDDDGEDCIVKALSSVRASLNERGITEANIFPVSAGVALEKRIDDEDEELLHPFYKKTKKYEAMRLNDYYEFSHQPLSVRERISDEMHALDGEDRIEYYSGIRNIEEAIRLYINKYARTTKVCDLVLSFNTQLNELATLAKLEDSIRSSSDFRKKLKKQIEKTKEAISDAEISKSFTKEIDETNYTDATITDIHRSINDAKRQFRELVAGKGMKVPVEQAERQRKTIESQFNQCAAQINVRVNGIIQSSFKETISKVISDYLRHLSNLGIAPQYFNLGSYSGISVSIPDLSQAISSSKTTYDESYITEEEVTVKIDSTKKRNASFAGVSGLGIGAALGGPAGALVGGLLGLIAGAISGHDDYYETRYRPKKVEKFVDYVDMNEVATSASHDFDTMLEKLESKAREYVTDETKKLKKNIKEKIEEIDRLLLGKLDELKSMEERDVLTAETIEKKRKDKEWLLEIQNRVNDLIEY